MTNRKPNIILLVLDTHRAERMSIYGYQNDITPALGVLAEESTVFDWAIAPAQWTIPSHASMFTGLYPTVHQTYQSYNSLPEDVPTVAELLSQSGYETVGFSLSRCWRADNGPKRGFHQFFDHSGTFRRPEFGRTDFCCAV
jgi:arylsulfatase A-like enzyme